MLFSRQKAICSRVTESHDCETFSAAVSVCQGGKDGTTVTYKSNSWFSWYQELQMLLIVPHILLLMHYKNFTHTI